jgi:hypothetical protein
MVQKALALPKRYGKTLILDLIVREWRPWWEVVTARPDPGKASRSSDR